MNAHEYHLTDDEIALKEAFKLTDRQAIMLCMIFEESGNAEIADILECKVGTVKSSIFKLYQSLGVSNRVGAALRAAQILWSKDAITAASNAE